MTREEAINWLKQIPDRYICGGDEAYDEKRKESINMAISVLRTQADMSPNDPLTLEHIRHGRWMKNTRFKQKRRKCSECGFDSEFEFNFCPNCGAQMDLTGDDWHA